jgi:hypothetical protein
MEDFELVNKIEKIELEPIGGSHYHIKVTGSVLRTGYIAPLLIIKSAMPDGQGNLIYYFAAQPPTGGNSGNPVPIEAERYLYELGGVKKLIFVSATNEMERSI